MTMPQSNLVAGQSVDRATFEDLYGGPAPWDIGKPQGCFTATAHRIISPVLDAGCGTGENALCLAAQGRLARRIASSTKSMPVTGWPSAVSNRAFSPVQQPAS